LTTKLTVTSSRLTYIKLHQNYTSNFTYLFFIILYSMMRKKLTQSISLMLKFVEYWTPCNHNFPTHQSA